MKVHEVFSLKNGASEEMQLIKALQSFDWKFDLSENLQRIRNGQDSLMILEKRIYNFWKQDPIRAIQLWNEYCPWASDESSMPPFIQKFLAQDNEPR